MKTSNARPVPGPTPSAASDAPHLVDTTMFFAPQSGGVKRYLLAKRAWLARRSDVRHTLLVPGAVERDDGNGLVTLAAPRIPFANGYRWPARSGIWRDQLVALAPDLIEAGDPYLLPWAALDAGQHLGVPVVGFYHSDLPRLIGARLGRWCEPGVERYLRRLYRQFDLVLAPSRVMADRLAAAGVERVALQPLGVDTRRFHPCRRDPGLRRELGLAEDTRLLVFAGRFSREKNIPLLLDAFRLLGPRYHLLLIGGGRCLRPHPNATVYPYQGRAGEVARLMASCDALVHAGDQETFGLVALEGMACGLPVVGVRAGAIAELVDAAVGLVVPPGSAAAIADGVVALYQGDPASLGRRARARVEAEYGWDRVLYGLLTHYGRLAAPAFEATEATACAAG